MFKLRFLWVSCLLVVGILGLNAVDLISIGQEGQQQAFPEFFGFYVRSGDQLVTLPERQVNFVFPTALGFGRECISGLFDLPRDDFKSNRMTFILFNTNAEKTINTVRLTKLKYVAQLPLLFVKTKNGKPDENNVTDIGMWIGENDIPIQTGPIQGKPGMFQIVTTAALEPGVYGIHWGSIMRTVIYEPRLPSGEMPRLAFAFSVDLNQPKIDESALKPVGDLLVSDTSGYGRIEATDGNIKKLLAIARDYLKTRTRVSQPDSYGKPSPANEARWIRAEVAPQLNSAYLAIIHALRLSDSISQTETSALFRTWLSELDAARELNSPQSRKAFSLVKSYDKERKVRLAINKFLKAEDKE